MTVKVSAKFDAGNVEVVDAKDPKNIQLKIRPDPYCKGDDITHFQWFHFRLTGVQNEHLVLKLVNAGKASFPEAWPGYRACASYDLKEWFRVNTTWDDKTGVIEMQHMSNHDAIYFAYFPPYSYVRHQELIARIHAKKNVRLEVIGETLDGYDLDVLRIGHPGKNKRVIWMVARQHPGEAMAEWFVEGFLDRLTDPHDGASMRVLEHAVFYVMPNVNPDGSIRGHLRTNALGANLNREWQDPTLERSPEAESSGMPAGDSNVAEVLAAPKGARRRPRDVPADDAAEDGQQQRKRRGRIGHMAGEPSGSTKDNQGLSAVEPAEDMLTDGLDGDRSNGEMLMECVVKIFCTHSEPNFSLPWQRKRQYSSTSSGFITAGKRILTNAHCVDHHTQVKVRRRGSDMKYVAQVLAVGTECDIAMLTVEDPAFWLGVEPVKFGVLPRLQDSVTVIGFPIGGDTMSVTSGVVSRIEVTSYVHGAAELLAIQIDAAINSGNSGGPAFNSKGECVGIAFQSLKHEDAENIGYVIPTPVMEHFINDYERNGQYTAFPALGIEWQKMESPFMRTALGMQADQKGVLIRRVEPTAPVSKSLKKGDILLSFDGVDIANDGTVPFRSGERISFNYLVSKKYTNEEAVLRVLSSGKAESMTVKLAQPVRLIPVHTKGRPPSYFIIAGLVFGQVSVPYLRSEYGKEYDFDAPVKLLDSMMHAMADKPDQQVVVLCQVLASDVNIGYEEIVNTQVHQVNGKPVKNLSDLTRQIEGCEDQYLRFDLEYNQLVILEREAAHAATKAIMTVHCIPKDRSADLLPESNGIQAADVPPANGSQLG